MISVHLQIRLSGNGTAFSVTTGRCIYRRASSPRRKRSLSAGGQEHSLSSSKASDLRESLLLP